MNKSGQAIPQHINDFLDWLDVEKGLSSKSQENYSRFLKKFLYWLKLENLWNLKPHELSPDHIWKYRVYLARNSQKQLKKSTQNYYLIALRSLLNFFADRNITSLPSEKIQLAKGKDDQQVRFLTLEQLKKLFSATDITKTNGARDRAILETFFSTGLRISELVALNRNQIKFRTGDKEFELGVIGKGGRVRTVYFSERALNWLKKYLDKRSDFEDALFVSSQGSKNHIGRLTPRSIQRMIKKYAVQAGIPLFTTPHVMRHTFATDLLAQGVDLRIIQEFLGHKSITATQIYAHVTNKKLREVHRKFHGGRKLQ